MYDRIFKKNKHIILKTDNAERLYVDLFLFDNMPKTKIKYHLKRLNSIFLRCYFVTRKQYRIAKKNNHPSLFTLHHSPTQNTPHHSRRYAGLGRHRYSWLNRCCDARCAPSFQGCGRRDW